MPGSPSLGCASSAAHPSRPSAASHNLTIYHIPSGWSLLSRAIFPGGLKFQQTPSNTPSLKTKRPGFATLISVLFLAAYKFAAAENVTAAAFNISETAAEKLCTMIMLFCVSKEHAGFWTLHANGKHFSLTEYCIKHKSLSMRQDLPFSFTIYWPKKTHIRASKFHLHYRNGTEVTDLFPDIIIG